MTGTLAGDLSRNVWPAPARAKAAVIGRSSRSVCVTELFLFMVSPRIESIISTTPNFVSIGNWPESC